VRVLSRRFRRTCLAYLKDAFEAKKLKFYGTLDRLNAPRAFYGLLQSARKTEWVVYSLPPFGGPSKVLDYLGRYIHRVAISNNRLMGLEDHKVTFRWKDYRHGSRIGPMTLDVDEFIRRFLLHVLPPHFTRVRQYGFLSNRHRAQKLAQCRSLIAKIESEMPEPPPDPCDWKSRYEKLTGISLDSCPACGKGRMICVEILEASWRCRSRRFKPKIDSS